MGSTRAELDALGIRAKKSLGQNFLADEGIAHRIVEAARVSRETVVIEIGPGLGALTKLLLLQAQHVIAIELDASLIKPLRDAVGQTEKLTVVQGDALQTDFRALVEAIPHHADRAAAVTFVGNLPYYITSHAIRRMLESPLQVERIVITVQLEVAQRLVARPPDMNLLAVGAQFYGAPELLFRIPPGAFFPAPKVYSAVVRITPNSQPHAVKPDAVFAVARAGFSQPRKQLRNTLSAGLGISRIQAAELLLTNGIDPTRRAETLGIDEWITLAKAHESHGTSRT